MASPKALFCLGLSVLLLTLACKRPTEQHSTVLASESREHVIKAAFKFFGFEDVDIAPAAMSPTWFRTASEPLDDGALRWFEFKRNDTTGKYSVAEVIHYPPRSPGIVDHFLRRVHKGKVYPPNKVVQSAADVAEVTLNGWPLREYLDLVDAGLAPPGANVRVSVVMHSSKMPKTLQVSFARSGAIRTGVRFVSLFAFAMSLEEAHAAGYTASSVAKVGASVTPPGMVLIPAAEAVEILARAGGAAFEDAEQFVTKKGTSLDALAIDCRGTGSVQGGATREGQFVRCAQCCRSSCAHYVKANRIGSDEACYNLCVGGEGCRALFPEGPSNFEVPPGRYD